MGMFVGLVDADGYIEIGPQKQYSGNSITTIRLRLGIRLEARDKELLEYIVFILGCGSLTFLPDKNQWRLYFAFDGKI